MSSNNDTSKNRCVRAAYKDEIDLTSFLKRSQILGRCRYGAVPHDRSLSIYPLGLGRGVGKSDPAA